MKQRYIFRKALVSCVTIISIFIIDSHFLLASNKNQNWRISHTKLEAFKNIDNEQDLIRVFGSNNVKRSKYRLPEGDYISINVLFPKDELKKTIIFWKNMNAYKGLKSLELRGDKSIWKISNGISLGTSLKKLELLNKKPFKMAGFGFEYEGTIYSWQKGELDSRLPKRYYRIRLRENDNISSDEADKITDDDSYYSNNRILQKMNPRIEYIRVRFK